jgi:asparagine synthase (glutamine-hydrolysing)
LCGILAVATPDGLPPASLLSASLDLMSHRGPDGRGVWVREEESGPRVWLGHRRLAIIDRSDGGAQPMARDDLVVTYNGEIYNYLELRTELRGLGHEFRSDSDTEVLLRAYQEWGVACVQHLNGMFAFALWDEGRMRLVVARDRFGEKPLHLSWDPTRSRLALASEIKPLLALPQVSHRLRERSLYRFFAFAEQAGSRETLWEGVERLPNAHTLTLQWTGSSFEAEIQPYWQIEPGRTLDLSPAKAAERFAELFRDSVRLRLRSDVPVGTSLSGGLDSSVVVCQISELLGRGSVQKTFSARMHDPRLDEGRYIGEVLRHTGLEGHSVWPNTDGLHECFARFCYHLEEPVWATSQFAQHEVMRLAQQHEVTVLLDGQGADELLGGYRPYFRVHYVDLLKRGKYATLAREWSGFRRRHPRAFPLDRRGAMAIAMPWALQAWRHLRRQPESGFAKGPLHGWLREDWLEGFSGEHPHFNAGGTGTALRQRLHHDALGGPLQELLRYGDRNSMAASREVRQPFLDHRLAELAFALPDEHKIHEGETKVLLRRASADLLPRAIHERQDKLGYEAPLRSWLNGALQSWARERLAAPPSGLRDLVAPKLVDTFDQGVATESQARLVFATLTLFQCWEELSSIGGDAGE